MSAPLLVMSGPPGSGKTTVAALAADRFAKSAHVLGDHFFRYIRSDWKHPASPEAYEQNRHVVDITTRAAVGYAKAGYTTILDGIFGPWFLEEVMAAAGDTELHYVVLRADLDTSIDRAVNRSDTPSTEDVVRSMHGDFDQLAQYEAYVIDTSTPSPDQVADLVMARFQAGELRLKG